MEAPHIPLPRSDRRSGFNSEDMSPLRIGEYVNLHLVEELYTPDSGGGHPDGYGWRAWVAQDGEPVAIQVFVTATSFSARDLDLWSWIHSRLDTWPADREDERSHLRQLLDAQPIQLMPAR